MASQKDLIEALSENGDTARGIFLAIFRDCTGTLCSLLMMGRGFIAT
jgi:hypothetical protein